MGKWSLVSIDYIYIERRSYLQVWEEWFKLDGLQYTPVGNNLGFKFWNFGMEGSEFVTYKISPKNY